MEYIHGGDIYGIAGPVLDFSANINPLGMPVEIKQALINSIDGWKHYPDPFCRQLIQAIAQKEGCQLEQIICGNGAADLIFRLVLAKRPTTAMVLAPTFAEYEQALKMVDCKIKYYDLNPCSYFSLDDTFLNELQGIEMFFLCQPNNPTGELVSPDLMKRILTVCQQREILLVVDECFLEFVEHAKRYEMISYLDHNNLFILKAFTKLYALAGLRLGYGISSNRALLEKMLLCGQPWSVSTPAQIAGIAALSLTGFPQQTQQYVKQQREYLLKQLTDLQYKVWSPQANYILFYSHHLELQQQLKQFQILIRDCSNYRGLEAGYYRIAVRSEQENRQLIAALKQIEKE